MPEPVDSIPVSLVVRLAKEKATIEEADLLLHLLFESTENCPNPQHIWQAIREIQNYFFQQRQTQQQQMLKPFVQMQFADNKGTINSMEHCNITPLSQTNPNTLPPCP